MLTIRQELLTLKWLDKPPSIERATTMGPSTESARQIIDKMFSMDTTRTPEQVISSMFESNKLSAVELAEIIIRLYKRLNPDPLPTKIRRYQ